MKIEKLKPGQIVWSLWRHQMGNTTLRTTSLYAVRILEVHAEEGWALVSWNGNKPERYRRNLIESLREKKPMMITGFMGQQRLATREEIKAEKARLAALEQNETTISQEQPSLTAGNLRP